MKPMSTRSTTHFVDSSFSKAGEEPFLSAIIYRHSDGYPEGAGKDLIEFLYRCQRLRDSRLNDVSYLAAKYVVFLSERFRRGADSLDFLSVGIHMTDPGDIEYRYIVDCGKIGADGLPHVKCLDMSGREHDIPR